MFLNWDLEKFFALVSRQRIAIATAIAATLVLAVVYMHVTKPSYTVSIQLVPAPASPQSTPGGGTIGAIAGGLLGGGNSPTPFKIYVAALQSHAVSEMIARDQKMMRRMYSDQWSERDHAWKEHVGLLHPVTAVIKGILGVYNSDWHPPSADDVYGFLQDSVTVVDSRDSPVVTVSMQSRDPKFAADFLQLLTSDVDLLTRDRALHRANEYIAFISQELEHVTVSEYRTALVNHLYEQEKSRMMASANKVGYSADVFSGPMASQRPTAPKLIPTLLTAIVMGSLLGLLLGFIYDLRGRVFTLTGLAGRYAKQRHGRLVDDVGA